MPRLEVRNPTEGKIASCPVCCDFQRGNFIVLYPGELDMAKAAGYSLDHLFIDSDLFGGQRARCVAHDTSTCDNGYKPLDCASYPFFSYSVSGAGRVTAFMKVRSARLSDRKSAPTGSGSSLSEPRCVFRAMPISVPN
jgi:hypothetical protein